MIINEKKVFRPNLKRRFKINLLQTKFGNVAEWFAVLKNIRNGS